MNHDQNFKNLILDYPREALEFFAPKEAAGITESAEITPVRQEQLQERLGDRFRELDTPLLVKFSKKKEQAVLFVLEEESDTRHFSIHRLAHYCIDVSDLLRIERLVPVVIFLRPGAYPLSFTLGTENDTYLHFHFIACDLGKIPAVEYADSRNIVARVNLPNMQQDNKDRVLFCLRAQEGLAQLESNPRKREKYIDFIAEYANLDEEEQTLYEQRIKQSAYKEEIMGPIQQARQARWDGIQLGIELKFGPDGLAQTPDIRELHDLEALCTIHNSLRTINSLEELQAMCYRYLDAGGKKH